MVTSTGQTRISAARACPAPIPSSRSPEIRDLAIARRSGASRSRATTPPSRNRRISSTVGLPGPPTVRIWRLVDCSRSQNNYKYGERVHLFLRNASMRSKVSPRPARVRHHQKSTTVLIALTARSREQSHPNRTHRVIQSERHLHPVVLSYILLHSQSLPSAYRA